MDKLFLDANVILDFFCERSDFYLPAAKLLVKSYNKEIELWCSPISLATASYFMEKGNVDATEIFRKISDMTTLCGVSKIDRGVVEKALASDFKDFEDALQYFSAEQCNADIIITRNKKDFMASMKPVLTPTEYLDIHKE